VKKAVFGALVLLAGLSLAQQADYRMEARAAGALSRLERVAERAGGEEKLLAWAKEVKARAERSHEAKAYFRALREAEAALHLYRAAQKAPWHTPSWRVKERAPKAVERAEKELAYYRGQDPLVKDLIAEAKGRLDKEPGRALLLSRAALALISAERGF